MSNRKMKNVTLEMSLKPFTRLDDEFVEATCREIFTQWQAMCKHAEMVSVLLWAADGSEILEYRGRDEDEIEWARYIGGANPKQNIPNDPEGRALHSRYYLYTENPPVVTYGDFRRIVATLKRVGQDVTGKPVRLGATFDPGPEFAKSPFKYERHHEICQAGTMGKDQHRFVTCYTHLHADDRSYAGFPDGVPEGTPLGAFLGRQSQCFMTDMGFDYLWLSNGFGFGKETWGTTGDLFDGEAFHPGKAGEIAMKIQEFWQTFRRECPDFRVETRGTNLSTGIDLASDATPYEWLNQAGLNFAPPPNSPWAAINGDFGLELAGYMSHIAELPDDADGYPFRFYTHDPWWLNSPWLDRYGREPHDIYLPMAVCRLDGDGKAKRPDSIEFLTVDDSYGQLPDEVPNEVTPHVLKALAHAPDVAGPLVWVYPFEDYHRHVFGDEPRLDLPFFGDWFIRGAINNGLPLNTVISGRNFRTSLESNPACYQESVIVTPLPDEQSSLGDMLCDFIQAGGKVLFYGPCDRAAPRLLNMLNVAQAESVSGELTVALNDSLSEFDGVALPERLNHRELFSAGGYSGVWAEAADPHSELLAEVSDGNGKRLAAITRTLPEWQGGQVGWVRGTVSASWPGGQLLLADDSSEFFIGESLMRYALASFGTRIAAVKNSPAQPSPIFSIARSNGGMFFSAYTPNLNVAARLKLPLGAPLFTGMDTTLQNGLAEYRLPRAYHGECRVFVTQDSPGELTCKEQFSGEVGVRRRLRVAGLADATVCFLIESGSENTLTFRKPENLYRDDLIIPHEIKETPAGLIAIAKGLSGNIVISW